MNVLAAAGKVALALASIALLDITVDYTEVDLEGRTVLRTRRARQLDARHQQRLDADRREAERWRRVEQARHALTIYDPGSLLCGALATIGVVTLSAGFVYMLVASAPSVALAVVLLGVGTVSLVVACVGDDVASSPPAPAVVDQAAALPADQWTLARAHIRDSVLVPWSMGRTHARNQLLIASVALLGTDATRIAEHAEHAGTDVVRALAEAALAR